MPPPPIHAHTRPLQEDDLDPSSRPDTLHQSSVLDSTQQPLSVTTVSLQGNEPASNSHLSASATGISNDAVSDLM